MTQVSAATSPFAFSPPFPEKRLADAYGRTIDYLRLAVTDRCNLRCRYCMPEEGVPSLSHGEILRFEEMERLVALFASRGVKKVRITGGEPFARKGLVSFIRRLRRLPGVETIHITTNGVAAAPRLPELKEAGLSGLNLSLDTLDRKRFRHVTRRDALDPVLHTLETALYLDLPLKINTVMLEDFPVGEIPWLAGLAQSFPVTVRFIEMMPFSGKQVKAAPSWTAKKILAALKAFYPDIVPEVHEMSSTARLYRVPGFAGKIGTIGGYSRDFCLRCNKVRITPGGLLKSCLYARGGLDLRMLLRGGTDDAGLIAEIARAVATKPENGRRAAVEHSGLASSMAAIGG